MTDDNIAQCAVCLESPGAELIRQKSCDHVICSSFAEKNIQSNRSCPKCQEPPLPTATAKVYGTVLSPWDSATNGKPTTNKDDPIYCDEYLDGNVLQTFKNPLYIRTCPDHKQRTEFFCNTCNTATCSRCLLKTHKVGEHDISSLDDFLDNQLEGKLKEIDNLEDKTIRFREEIEDAKQLSEANIKSLWSIVLSKQSKASSAVQSMMEDLSQIFEENQKARSEFFSSMETQRSDILTDIDQNREVAKRLMDASTGSKETIPIEMIEKRIIDIGRRCDKVGSMKLPDKLKLIYDDQNENFESMTLGDLVTPRPAVCYVNSSQSKKLRLRRTLAIDDDEFDFANVVPITEEWIVHVSNLYSSTNVTIKHYKLRGNSSSRESLVLDMNHYDWTLAKVAGHDRSVLLASGDTVHRISFRMENRDFKQKMKVSFNIEAVSWDEFGVDCYLLAKNLRDVHWLSMNGDVTFLCSLQTDIQSASSMNVSDQCVISILDPSMQKVCVMDYTDTKATANFPLTHPLLEGWKSDKSSPSLPLAMAWSRLLLRYFVLYSPNESVIVGEYDKKYRFQRFTVVPEIPNQSSVLDMAVKEDRLILLFESSVAMYKIESDQTDSSGP